MQSKDKAPFETPKKYTRYDIEDLIPYQLINIMCGIFDHTICLKFLEQQWSLKNIKSAKATARCIFSESEWGFPVWECYTDYIIASIISMSFYI